MTTHSADFNVGLAGQTLVTKLFALGTSDTVANTASTTVDQTNRVGFVRAAFTTVASGRYLLVATASGVQKASYIVVFAGTDNEVVEPMEPANLLQWLGTAPLALSSQQVQAVVPVTTVVASMSGDVGGKVIGGGVGTITGTGARAVNSLGGVIATESNVDDTKAFASSAAGSASSAATSAASAATSSGTAATNTGTLLTNLATLAAKFAGMTLLPDWLRRGFRKDAGTAGMGVAETEIQSGGSATYVGTTDNLEAIKDAGGGGGGDVTINVVVPSAVATASQEVNTITAVRGDTLRRSFEDLGNLLTRTQLWVTVKRLESDADSAAILQITEAGGLITFNGAAASSSALGSVTVDVAATGDITIFVDETITAQFGLWQGYVFDVQWKSATDTTTPLTGVFNVSADVTKATS